MYVAIWKSLPKQTRMNHWSIAYTRSISLMLLLIHMGYWPSLFGQDGWILAKFFFSRVYGLLSSKGKKEIISFFCCLRWTPEETIAEKSKWPCNFLIASSAPLSKVFIADRGKIKWNEFSCIGNFPFNKFICLVFRNFTDNPTGRNIGW